MKLGNLDHFVIGWRRQYTHENFGKHGFAGAGRGRQVAHCGAQQRRSTRLVWRDLTSNIAYVYRCTTCNIDYVRSIQ